MEKGINKNKNTSKEEQEIINTNRKAFSNWAIQKFTNLHPILQKTKNPQKNDVDIVIPKHKNEKN